MPEGPKNYYVIRMQMVHVRKGKWKYNEKLRESSSFIESETNIRRLWQKIQHILDEEPQSVRFQL